MPLSANAKFAKAYCMAPRIEFRENQIAIETL